MNASVIDLPLPPTPLPIPNRSWRSAKAVAVPSVMALLLLLLAFLFMIGRAMPPPHFVIAKGQATITPALNQPWRRVSDWLIHRKYAVLTFDDGPEGSGLDERILDVLRLHHAHAIFFLVCKKIDSNTSRVLGEIERDGHLIGNHSFDHLKLTQISSSDLRYQIEGCSARLASVTGHRPRYFRPPWGMTSSSVGRAAEAAGMEQVLWNANSYDFALKNPDDIVRITSQMTDDADVILMHERATTASALDKILTNLEKDGFQFILPDDPA